MKIAIPDWDGRISPVFDVAERILLVDLGPEGERSERRWCRLPRAVDQRTSVLADAGVETLICAAISRPLETAIAAQGITVIPQLCGSVEDILAAVASGALNDARYRMPGCCGRQRRLRGGRGRR